MRNDRLIVGLICCAVAAWIFLSESSDERTAAAVAFLVLGLASIASARRRNS